jgi:anti-sigma regulatory factor (Ser/Thr protein kinase)
MSLSSFQTLTTRFNDTYPALAEHIGQIRIDLRSLLGERPVADDVILCASELAANAVLHSDSGKSGGKFTIRVEVLPRQYAQIEVEDSGGEWIAANPDPDRGRGHGLDIVGALAAEWGIDGDHHARTVWARFEWQ